jgi:hypothetical protein
MGEETTPSPSSQPRRVEDFIFKYANNVQFVMSVWDLKLIFADAQQQEGNEVLQQHTGITMPWLQVKLLRRFLQLNLILHEKVNGKIIVPPHLLPLIQPPSDAVTDPQQKAISEAIFFTTVQFFSAKW